MDAIRAHLTKREAGGHANDGGLDYLVDEWTRIAATVEGGREQWWREEWLNDLDTRELLQDLLDHVPESRVATRQIEEADSRFLRAAIATDECQWGAKNSAAHRLTSEKNWWYWRLPPTPYV